MIALVDSGADWSVIPLELAPRLGVDLGECRHVPGHSAGGRTEFYEWEGKLTAELMERQIPLHVMFGAVPIVLLGREDFFANFQVSFDQRGKRFTLVPY